MCSAFLNSLPRSSIGALAYPKPSPQNSMDGPRFWALVAGITPFVSFVLRHHIAPSEAIYPYDAPTARFSSQSGIPAILLTTLPHLTKEHDTLFDALEAEVNRWPTATLGEHYKHLFGWLAEHFDKRLWVERSGGGLVMAELILATFPDARFIHIVRDGRDAAISMQEHVGFRTFLVMSSLGQLLGVDPCVSPDRTHIDRVPAELRPFLPEHFDADAFRAFHVPLTALRGELDAADRQRTEDAAHASRRSPPDPSLRGFFRRSQEATRHPHRLPRR